MWPALVVSELPLLQAHTEDHQRKESSIPAAAFWALKRYFKTKQTIQHTQHHATSKQPTTENPDPKGNQKKNFYSCSDVEIATVVIWPPAMGFSKWFILPDGSFLLAATSSKNPLQIHPVLLVLAESVSAQFPRVKLQTLLGFSNKHEAHFDAGSHFTNRRRLRGWLGAF